MTKCLSIEKVNLDAIDILIGGLLESIKLTTNDNSPRRLANDIQYYILEYKHSLIWPKEYPILKEDEEEAFFYFRRPGHKAQPVLVMRETCVDFGFDDTDERDRNILIFDDNDHGGANPLCYISFTEPEWWGPRVPMWED